MSRDVDETADEVARAVATAVHRAVAPAPAVDLAEVRRRGRRRRTVRRALVAAPVCAVALVVAGTAWQAPWERRASIAPAVPLPAPSGTSSPDWTMTWSDEAPEPSGDAREQGRQSVEAPLVAALDEALTAVGAGFRYGGRDDVHLDGSAPVVATLVVDDVRTRPATRLTVTLREARAPEGPVALPDALCPADPAEETRSCAQEILAQGLHLVTWERVGQWYSERTGAGTERTEEVWTPVVRAVHPDGRVVEATTQVLYPDLAAAGAPGRAAASVSPEQLRALVTHPALVDVDLP